IFTRSSFFPLKIHFKGRQLPAFREFSQIFLCLRNTENADLATAAENFLFPTSPTYYDSLCDFAKRIKKNAANLFQTYSFRWPPMGGGYSVLKVQVRLAL